MSPDGEHAPDHDVADAALTADDQILVEFILQKFDELLGVLRQLDDEQANATLPADGSNSVVQLVTHCCGMMRRWSSTVNLGMEVPRDRRAEFQAVMPAAEALELAARTRELFLKDVTQTDFGAAPVHVPPGRDHFWTASCRGVLFHVLEEIAQHLGQAEITRDCLGGH